MECLGYNEDSPVLGTDGLCRFHWTAPHPHFVGSFDANGGYPLQEPGSLNLVNASTPQQPTFDTTLGEDFLLYLDPSVSCSSKPTQLKSAKFGIEPNTHIQQPLLVEIYTDPFCRSILI